MTLLTVNRTGEFTIAGCTDGPQCGSMVSRNYKYHVAITGESGDLDREGFIIDNIEIDRYFMDRYEGKEISATSCENIALVALLHFQNITKGMRVKVTISGSEHSFIEAEVAGTRP